MNDMSWPAPRTVQTKNQRPPPTLTRRSGGHQGEEEQQSGPHTAGCASGPVCSDDKQPRTLFSARFALKMNALTE